MAPTCNEGNCSGSLVNQLQHIDTNIHVHTITKEFEIQYDSFKLSDQNFSLVLGRMYKILIVYFDKDFFRNKVVV